MTVEDVAGVITTAVTVVVACHVAIAAFVLVRRAMQSV